MSRPSEVIAIVEDAHQGQLVRHYLNSCGLGRRARILPSPPGSGSAEKWVRDRFPIEVNLFRTRNAKTTKYLIVMIDADTDTVQHLIAQFDNALRDSASMPVEENESIVRLVPKRNVETWILCLNDQETNEADDYSGRHEDWTRLIKNAGSSLLAWQQDSRRIPNGCVDSLRTGIRELQRLQL